MGTYGGNIVNGFGRGEDKQKEKKLSVISRETVGMTLLLFSAIAFLIIVTGPFLFGDVGRAITAFFVGVFGFMAYPLLLAVVVLSFGLVIGKKILSRRWVLSLGLLTVAVFFIVHTATAPYRGLTYGEYLAACWNAAAESAANGTGGGVIFGVIDYPICAVLTDAGAYVIFALLTALALYLVLLLTPLGKYISFSKSRARKRAPAPTPAPETAPRTEGTRPYPGAISFSELPGAPRASAGADTYAYAPPAYPAPPAQYSRANDAQARGRELLFGDDPAMNYRTNLIYDKDSYFNHRGATPPYAQQQQQQPRPATPPEEGGYGAQYAAQAEGERPAFPRKVMEERPRPSDGYSYPVDEDYDANYTQTPSYRAPEQPQERARDFYAHDVEQETFSSQPNVYDTPAPETPAPSRFAPEEGAAPSRFAPEERVAPPSRFAPETPASSRFAPEEGAAPSRFAPEERTESPRPAAPEPPKAEPPQEEPEEESRESQFRSLFSRSFEERTHVERPLPFDRREPPREETPQEPAAEEDAPPPESRVFDADMRKGVAELFDDDDFDGGDYREEPTPAMPARDRARRELREEDFSAPPRVPAAAEEPPAPPAPPARHIYREYVRPSTANFTEYNDTVTMQEDEIERNTSIIVDTLAGFKVDAEVVKVTIGPAVTRYDIDIPRNITVGTVIKRDAEIAMRLHARDGVNMYANNMSGAISIEVPNAHRATVGIKSVLQAEEYQNAKEGSLMFVIGKDVENKNVCGNIAKMKHLLVAGSTGSGKSVCLNAMLISLICKYSPEDLRLILIDPKKVEFAVFDGLPHLMINEIIADAQKAVTALKWAIEEMERRYRLFEQKTREQHITVRNVDEYNGVRTEDEAKLPKIVIVVDELADLMAVAKKDIEERIQRLAQKARAAGIHLVIATQRPSVDVITGVIKGNLPTRLAFRVIQEVDSRTILDESGAEKLLGNGDMLFRTEGMFNCLRVQGAFLSSAEVQAVVDDIKANNEAYFDENVASFINSPGSSAGEGGMDEDDGSANPQYIRALGIVVKLGQASISLIQRKCSVGYNHAGKIIEWMEAMGYISPFDGKAKAREVLMTQEEFEAKYGKIN